MTRRGASNGNRRGSSEARRRRREYLLTTYRADCDLFTIPFDPPVEVPTLLGAGVPACRCYRCGKLLTAETVTVDRIKPGCEGGTYRRSNIRPSCMTCASRTGGAIGAARKANLGGKP